MARFIRVDNIPGQSPDRVGWLDRKNHKIGFVDPFARGGLDRGISIRRMIRSSPDFKKFSLALDEAMKPFKDQVKLTTDILDAAEERIDLDLRLLGWDSKAITNLKRHVRENREYPEAPQQTGIDWKAHDLLKSRALDVYQFKPSGVSLDSLYGEGWKK